MDLHRLFGNFPGVNHKTVAGVVMGIVTNNKDPENIGRVKVKFPWLSDSNESNWARVSTFMAGKDRGSFFLPEVGDEVLVAFAHGDINSPYVIGALWNGGDPPPANNSDGKNNIRKIRSRSGHEIIFDDTRGQEKIMIRSASGHSVVLDDTGGSGKIEIVDKTSNNKIWIDPIQNSLSLESSAQLKIKSAQIEIEGTGSLTLKSHGILTVQGSMVKIN